MPVAQKIKAAGRTLIGIGNRKNTNKPISVKTDAQGACWIVLGTDSAYEGLTRLYYDKVGVVFTPQAK